MKVNTDRAREGQRLDWRTSWWRLHVSFDALLTLNRRIANVMHMEAAGPDCCIPGGFGAACKRLAYLVSKRPRRKADNLCQRS